MKWLLLIIVSFAIIACSEEYYWRKEGPRYLKGDVNKSVIILDTIHLDGFWVEFNDKTQEDEDFHDLNVFVQNMIDTSNVNFEYFKKIVNEGKPLVILQEFQFLSFIYNRQEHKYFSKYIDGKNASIKKDRICSLDRGKYIFWIYKISGDFILVNIYDRLYQHFLPTDKAFKISKNRFVQAIAPIGCKND